MTKADLIERVAAKTGDTKAGSARAVNAALEAIRETLIEKGHLELVGFGSFSTVNKAERVGRNPQTGEAVTIPAHRAVKFKAGKSLREAVN